jgi:hypothetical protein
MNRIKFFKLIGCTLIAIVLVLLIIAPRAGASDIRVASHADAAAPWVVFTPATNTLPMLANVLVNSGFEDGAPGSASNWNNYGTGYGIDETGGRTGGRALRLINAISTESHGAYQIITLNQTQTHPIYLSGWSKADGIAGTTDSNYSIYLDVYYTKKQSQLQADNIRVIRHTLDGQPIEPTDLAEQTNWR